MSKSKAVVGSIKIFGHCDNQFMYLLDWIIGCPFIQTFIINMSLTVRVFLSEINLRICRLKDKNPGASVQILLRLHQSVEDQ